MGVLVAAVVAVATLSSCSGPSTAESFCAELTLVQNAGPLFPARTDGEPVPDPAALAALERLLEHRPEPIAEEIGVLVDEARALSIEAQERLGQTAQVEPPNRRWSRSAVESAQRAVIAYSAEECDISLIPTSQG